MGPVLTKPEIKVRQKLTPAIPSKKVKPEYGGICTSCKNNETCSFPRNIERPVLQCEEWEGYTSKPVAVVNKEMKKSLDLLTKTISEEVEKFPGICKYCALKDECTFPKSEGGIWICDEYTEENR